MLCLVDRKLQTLIPLLKMEAESLGDAPVRTNHKGYLRTRAPPTFPFERMIQVLQQRTRLFHPNTKLFHATAPH